MRTDAGCHHRGAQRLRDLLLFLTFAVARASSPADPLPQFGKRETGNGKRLTAFRSAFRIPSSAFLILFFVSSLVAQSPWRAGQYHGLVPGKSSRAAVLKALGPPTETRTPSLAAFAAPACCEELLYRARADNGGDLSIAIRKGGEVVYIIDQFKTAMPRSTAYRKYGKDWHSRTYAFAKCAEHAGVVPLYREPGGPIELVEYPGRGILFWPADDAYDFFGVIYLAHAPGLTKPPACVKTTKH